MLPFFFMLIKLNFGSFSKNSNPTKGLAIIGKFQQHLVQFLANSTPIKSKSLTFSFI